MVFLENSAQNPEKKTDSGPVERLRLFHFQDLPKVSSLYFLGFARLANKTSDKTFWYIQKKY